MTVLTSIGYPLETDGKGGLKLATRADVVTQQIISVLETRPGERIMLPFYGMREHIMNALAPNVVVSDIEQIVQKWVPQAKNVKVTFLKDTELFEQGKLAVTIRFEYEEVDTEFTVEVSDG